MKGATSDALQTAADIVRGLPIGMMTFRLDSPETLTLVDVNAMALALVHGTADDWIGKRFEELWPPAMVGKVKPGIVAAAKGGAPYENEVVLRRGSELRHAFRVRGYAIPGERVVLAFEDVMSQRLAEESLSRSEAKYRSLIEDLDDVVYVMDEGGVLTYVSPGATRLLGYTPREVLGKHYSDFAPPGELPSMDRLTKMLADPPATMLRDYRLIARGGAVVWVRASGHLVLAPDGKPKGVHGILTDITERHRAEEVVEKARRDMDLVLNATRDCFAYYSPSLTVEWVNRAAASAIGKNERDMIGRRCHEVWQCASRDGGECAVQRVIKSGTPQESRETTSDGKTFVVRAYPAFEDDRLVGVVECTVDITDTLRAQEERERMETQLRQSQKLESIGTLASGIAHEVNNPLTGMINYAELIAARVEDDRLREFALGIKEEGARVAGIVRNLLSFARQDSGETTGVPPVRLAETTLMLIRSVLERDGIDVRVDVPDGLPPVDCRAQQIEQVLLNLLTNARDALNERFPAVSTREKWLALTGETVQKAGAVWVRLSVVDNGTGIPEAIRERVLDPFFTTKPRDRGTGLGLSISYGIVRDHGGHLWIESLLPSCGATAVHVDLPVASAPDENR